MPRLKNCLICPKCGQKGGTIGKRPVKDHVQLPNKERIMALKPLDHRNETGWLVTMEFSLAFDFAAKVFLALESRAIAYPDPSREREDSRADAIYKELQSFDPRAEIYRQQFEANWIDETKHNILKRVSQRVKNNLENDKKLMKSALSGREKGYAETGHQWYFMDDPLEQRIRTPTAEYMQISRYSISLHYAAILFTALSHLAADHRLPSLLYGYSESLYALAIYSVFNRLRYIIDRRSRRTMKDWSRIIDTRIKHGYNAASSLATNIPAALCSKCHSQGIKKMPPMKIRPKDDGSTEWYCTRCGGTENLQGRLTGENIKKRECKVASDIELLIKYAPFYEDFKRTFSSYLKANSKLREDLKDT